MTFVLFLIFLIFRKIRKIRSNTQGIGEGRQSSRCRGRLRCGRLFFFLKKRCGRFFFGKKEALPFNSLRIIPNFPTFPNFPEN